MKDKRQKIIDAAESLIAESGFQGLSMHKLAKEAGVAAGTIYRYFSDKEDLLQQVRLEVTQRNAEAIQRGVDESTGGWDGRGTRRRERSAQRR